MRALILCFLLACGPKNDPMPAEATPSAEPSAEPAPQPTPPPAPVPEAAPEAEPEADPEATPEPTEDPFEDAEIPSPAVGSTADGAACLTAAECASGVCEGEGCGDDQPGICAPKMRPCTRDRRPYCGCDGETIYGSSSCPMTRYSAKGMCE